MNESIITVCPNCKSSWQLPESQKNTRIECAGCKKSFMAYNAEKCSYCGKYKHPNHDCSCAIFKSVRDENKSDANENQLNSEQNMTSIFYSLPENIQAVFRNEFIKYEKLITAMQKEINELRDLIYDLEDKIEDL